MGHGDCGLFSQLGKRVNHHDCVLPEIGTWPPSTIAIANSVNQPSNTLNLKYMVLQKKSSFPKRDKRHSKYRVCYTNTKFKDHVLGKGRVINVYIHWHIIAMWKALFLNAIYELGIVSANRFVWNGAYHVLENSSSYPDGIIQMEYFERHWLYSESCFANYVLKKV